MNRPIPPASAMSQPFWDAAAEGRLVVQSCEACGHLQHYPRAYCLKCLSEALGWHQCSGRGAIYSYTVVRKAMHPGFAALVPYVYALVELEEGVRMTTNIVHVSPEEVRCGQRVSVDWSIQLDDGRCLPTFAPTVR